MSNFDWFEESIKVLPTSHFVEVRDKKIHTYSGESQINQDFCLSMATVLMLIGGTL